MLSLWVPPKIDIFIPSLISPTLSSFHFSHSALGYDIFCKYCFISLLCMLSHFSCVQLFATLWTIVCQTPLSMGFPRQEYWSGLSFPSPGDLLKPGIEPTSPSWQVDSLPLSPKGSPKVGFSLAPNILCMYFFIICLSPH